MSPRMCLLGQIYSQNCKYCNSVDEIFLLFLIPTARFSKDLYECLIKRACFCTILQHTIFKVFFTIFFLLGSFRCRDQIKSNDVHYEIKSYKNN